MDSILQTYDITTEFPSSWDESRQDLADTTVGATSKKVLINQLITNLKSSNMDTTNDETDPLGHGQSVFNTMHSKGLDIDSLPDERGVYLPSSTKFNARAYLNVVHGDSSFEQLKQSLNYLKHSISQKSNREVNVGEDYKQFVTSKQQLDHVLAMISSDKSDGLHVHQLTDQLDEALRSYTLLMRPLEECAGVRERYQTALGLVKSHKYVLGLPSTLAQHLRNLEHDEFIRDWRTGRDYLAELKESSKSVDCHKIANLIEEKVRVIVEEYRVTVWKQLMHTQVDKLYARHLEMLHDLEVKENPLYEWMKYQVTQIHGGFNDFFERSAQKLTSIYRVERLQESDTADVVTYLKNLESDTTCLDSYDVIEHWMALQQVFGSLHEHVIKAMAFWKEYNLILSGRKTVASIQLNSQQELEIRNKFLAIVEQISISLLSLAEPPQDDSEMTGTNCYFPKNANSLSTARYLNQISNILTAIESEVNQPVFSQTLVRIRTLFVNLISNSWLRDCRNLGKLQDLSKGDANKNLNIATACFESFHKWILSEIRKIGLPPSKQLDSTFTAVLSSSLQSFYQHLGECRTMQGAGIMVDGLSPEPIDQEVRLLITMSNVYTIKTEAIPELYKVYAILFERNGGDANYKAIGETADELGKEMFTHYTQTKRSQINKIMTDSLTSKSAVWAAQNEDPKKISQHIYEVLMLLVETQAKFIVYAPHHIAPILRDLYHHFLTVFLQGVREFDQLGRLGTLQLIADLDFVCEIMVTLHSPKEQRLYAQTTEAIKAISSKSLVADRDAPSKKVAPLVERSLDQEKLAFACFKTISRT